MKQINIRLEEAMKKTVNKAVANASAVRGEPISRSEWIRDAITEKAEREQRTSK